MWRICDLGWINDTQGSVDAMLIAAVVGLIVGTICFGVLALSLWFTVLTGRSGTRLCLDSCTCELVLR